MAPPPQRVEAFSSSFSSCSFFVSRCQCHRERRSTTQRTTTQQYSQQHSHSTLQQQWQGRNCDDRRGKSSSLTTRQKKTTAQHPIIYHAAQQQPSSSLLGTRLDAHRLVLPEYDAGRLDRIFSAVTYNTKDDKDDATYHSAARPGLGGGRRRAGGGHDRRGGRAGAARRHCGCGLCPVQSCLGGRVADHERQRTAAGGTVLESPGHDGTRRNGTAGSVQIAVGVVVESVAGAIGGAGVFLFALRRHDRLHGAGRGQRGDGAVE